MDAAGTNGATISDPIAPIILGIGAILFFALIGRYLSRGLGQPPVLGELVMGVLLGNAASLLGHDLILLLREGPALFAAVSLPLPDFGFRSTTPTGDVSPAVRAVLARPDAPDLLQVAHAVDLFARFGLLFLLFHVGLGTSLGELRRVGAESLRVAVVGVVLPFSLGLAVSSLFLPELPLASRLFIASTLAATSVGITASVLEDGGLLHTREAGVILGAAVIDDVLGLMLLAVVAGVVVSGHLDLGAAGMVLLRAGLFIGGAALIAPRLLRGLARLVINMDLIEAKQFISISFALAMAWLADRFGLAPIVGAFMAGLLLNDHDFHQGLRAERRRYQLRDLIQPLEMFLVPFFFVLMGMQVKLETFADPEVLLLAVGLLLVAVLGKLAAGVATDRGTNGLAVGIGMMPRGEVGLVFAASGRALGVIDDALFAAIVLMVTVTTLVAPGLLGWSFRRKSPDIP